MDPTTTEAIYTVISLTASVASLVLAVIAIWIALYGKREVERTNQKTQDLLTEVRSDAKSIAQYAIPELRAYGDSVRKFVFQKGETDSDSSSLLSKVENVLTENMHRIRGEIDSIRKEKDVSAVRHRLDDLEIQLRSSQESVRKSVEDSSRRLEVSLNGEPYFVFPRIDWVAFLLHLEENEDYKIEEYGKRWTFVDPKTERRIPEKHIRAKRSFSDLEIGAVDKLNIVNLT